MCPDARILMVLRNPADRAYSQYLQVLASSQEHMSFREYVEAAAHCTSTLIGPLFPFLHFGRYFDQVTRYLKFFRREQLQIVLYEDYQRSPLATLHGIFQFLEVDGTFAPDMQQRFMLAKVPRSHALQRVLRPACARAPLRVLTGSGFRRSMKGLVYRPRASMTMDARDRAFLVDFYREDIQNLAHLLNRDLRSWLNES